MHRIYLFFYRCATAAILGQRARRREEEEEEEEAEAEEGPMQLEN